MFDCRLLVDLLVPWKAAHEVGTRRQHGPSGGWSEAGACGERAEGNPVWTEDRTVPHLPPQEPLAEAEEELLMPYSDCICWSSCARAALFLSLMRFLFRAWGKKFY